MVLEAGLLKLLGQDPSNVEANELEDHPPNCCEAGFKNIAISPTQAELSESVKETSTNVL